MTTPDEWLTSEQAETLWLEYELLRRQEEEAARRMKEILDAIRESDKSKVRAMREAEERARR